MGRAGAGGGGGGRAGGGHSMGRSSGGHSVGGGSRAGGGMGPGGMGGMGPGGMGGPGRMPGGMGGPGMPPPRRPRRGWGFGGGWGFGFGGCLTPFILLAIVMVVVFSSFTSCFAAGGRRMMDAGSQSSVTESSYAREKVDLGITFDSDCVIDELGWFDSPTRTAKELEYFFEKTGVQPFVYLKAYDPSIQTESEKEAWANEWYEENIDNEATFLYVYFSEKNQDQDVGYMCYVGGTQTASMMDDEAVEIFWDYIDTYWFSDLSTDDLFETVFTKTADTITTKSRTAADVAYIAAIIVLVIVIGVVIVAVIQKKRRAEAERAAETERILNTPLDKL